MRLRGVAIVAVLAWSLAIPAEAAGGGAFDATIASSKAAMMADPAEALRFARKAEALAAQAPADRLIAEATAEWLEGEATARLGRSAEALATLEQAYGKARQAKAGEKLVADILLSRGWAQGTLGRVHPALEDFQNAYVLYRRLGEQRGQAKALQNIGGIYHDAGDNERSLTYYSQVAELAGDDPAIGLAARNNLGETLKALGRYREAQVQYRLALVEAKRLGSDLLQVRILTNLASTQVHDGEIAAGEASARNALAFAHGEANGERPFAVGVLALAAEKRGDTGKAAELMNSVFAGQDLTNTPLSYRDFHESAARVYAAVNRDRLAYEHLSAFKRLDDGARMLAASTNAALMAARFDFANQHSRISDLKAGQARRDREMAQSRARYQTILFSGALAAGGIVLAILLFSVFSLRRSRNDVRRANGELSTSNESLAKALRAKSEFLATTSHEIRTPLNGILGMTQIMLADPRVAAEMKERIEIVHGAGETMRALVDDILDLAKIENGNLQIRPAPFDPGRLIGEVARLWRAPAEQKGLVYSAEIAALPASVMGDETRLRQILCNVLSNAVKFTPTGSVSLTVSAIDGRLAIRVADTGIGIPAHEQDAIFERFYQVDGGTSRRFGGTGLGLAICRHLADAMGGSIMVESAIGEGSTFRIDLPLEIVDAMADPAAAATGSCNILLVVEPNPLAQRIMAKALEGVAVAFVGTVEAACERIADGGVVQTLFQVDTFLAGDDPLSQIRRIADAVRRSETLLTVLYTPSEHLTDAGLTALGAVPIAKPVAMKDVLARLHLHPVQPDRMPVATATTG